MTLIKSIYGLIQAARLWFKEYIKTMALKAGFKKCNTGPCLLYRVNELGTIIFIIYVDGTLEIGYKLALMNTIECIRKEYVTLSMG